MSSIQSEERELQRSRERERRRRKAQAQCIKNLGGFKSLAKAEGREPVKLVWDGFQWYAQSDKSAGDMSDPILINCTRKLRRLYFGSLPTHLGLTEEQFNDVIFAAMRKLKLCNDPDRNPVLCTWIAKEKGNYGFVEFATVEETERARALDGMIILGTPVRVSRPCDYSSGSGSATGLDAQSAQLLEGFVPNRSQALEAGAAMALETLKTGTQSVAGSRVLVFRQLILSSDVSKKEDYLELFDDILDGVSNFGRVQVAALITPDLAKGDESFNAGDVFLKFATAEEAKNCEIGMRSRRFFDRPIQIHFIANRVWLNKLRCLPESVVRHFHVETS